MPNRIAMSVDMTRIYSTAVIDGEGGFAAEVLVLQDFVEGLEAAGDALGLEFVRVTPDQGQSVADLRRLVSSLWPASGREHDLGQIDSFLDTLVFTRQIPLEESPIERWSLAELWTRSVSTASGAATGIGIAHTAGHSGYVLVLCGVFGTLLMRPLTAISQGIAEGLQPPVREATERYARRWLRSEAEEPSRRRASTTEPPAPAHRETREHSAREEEILRAAFGTIRSVQEDFKNLAPYLERLEPEADGEPAASTAARHLENLPTIRFDPKRSPPLSPEPRLTPATFQAHFRASCASLTESNQN